MQVSLQMLVPPKNAEGMAKAGEDNGLECRPATAGIVS